MPQVDESISIADRVSSAAMGVALVVAVTLIGVVGPNVALSAALSDSDVARTSHPVLDAGHERIRTHAPSPGSKKQAPGSRTDLTAPRMRGAVPDSGR